MNGEEEKRRSGKRKVKGGKILADFCIAYLITLKHIFVHIFVR